MKDHKDTYQTITKPSTGILYKDKSSKFFGYAFPIETEAEVKPIINALQKKHHSAGHVCYAWQLGVENPSFRANDDGEPNHSAGMPIYGQLQSFKVTNILVVVARIFGGKKLGVSGLTHAYRSAAQMALQESKIVTKTQMVKFQLIFEYAAMDTVMRIIKQRQLPITKQELETSCKLLLLVRKNDEEKTEKLFEQKHGISIKKIVP